MAKYKIMYIHKEMPDISIEEEILKEIDAEIVVTESIEEGDIIQCGKDCDAILVDHDPVSKNLIDRLEKCQVIVRQGIGYNNVDVEAAGKKGIMVANCPDYCHEEVADHAMALMLTCARKTAAFNQAAREGIWDVKAMGPIYRLRNRIFGIYGFGNIARKVAERAKAFGFQVESFDPYVADAAFNEAGVKKADSLIELAQRADILSVHVPMTKDTKNTVNMSVFERMKPNSILINTSRGPVINEGDLIEALEKKMIAMAGLDVFVEEPPAADSKFYTMENVVITPHASFYSEESDRDLRIRTSEEIVNVLTHGHPSLHCFVNKKEFGY